MKSLLAVSLLLCLSSAAMAVPKHNSPAANHPPRPKETDFHHHPAPKKPSPKKAKRTPKKAPTVKRSVAKPHQNGSLPRPKRPTPKHPVRHRLPADPAIKESGTTRLVPDQENDSNGTDLPPPSQP